MSLLLLAIFITILPQTLALKPTASVITLTSPNPLDYVSGTGNPGGWNGKNVAYGGNYIFVHGEGNFYDTTLKAKH